MSVENIRSEQHFNDVLASNKHVLIDFWASWCGPCKAMAPTFEEIAYEQEKSVKSVKVNVDDLPMLAQKFGIRSIPSLYFLKEKLVISDHIGNASKQELSNWLDKLNIGEINES